MFNAPPSIDRKRTQTKRQKWLTFLAIVPLSFLAMLGSVNVVVTIIAFFRDDMDPPILDVGLIGGATCAVSVVGLIILVPLFRRPLEFGGPLSNIPPDAQGQPFAAQLRRKTSGLAGASFRGKGVIQFLPDRLIVAGKREPHIIIQIAIVATMIMLPKAQPPIGVACFSAAILIGAVLSLKKHVQEIPYQAIQSIQQNGKWTTIDIPGLKPSTLVFTVDVADGQRLSGELHPRFGDIIPGAAVGR